MWVPAGHLMVAPKDPRSSSSGGPGCSPGQPWGGVPLLVTWPFFAGVPGLPLAGALLRLPGGAVVQASTLRPQQEGLLLVAREGRAGGTRAGEPSVTGGSQRPSSEVAVYSTETGQWE